jgi:hypothetical protein
MGSTFTAFLHRKQNKRECSPGRCCVRCIGYSNYCNLIDSSVGDIDLYQVMRAAGKVEVLLGLIAHAKYERPNSTGPRLEIGHGKCQSL